MEIMEMKKKTGMEEIDGEDRKCEWTEIKWDEIKK